eukprot:1258757-Pyramimonas_sp.AAC.1
MVRVIFWRGRGEHPYNPSCLYICSKAPTTNFGSGRGRLPQPPLASDGSAPDGSHGVARFLPLPNGD